MGASPLEAFLWKSKAWFLTRKTPCSTTQDMVYVKRCEMMQALRDQALVQSAVGGFQDACQTLQQAARLLEEEEKEEAEARARGLLADKERQRIASPPPCPRSEGEITKTGQGHGFSNSRRKMDVWANRGPSAAGAAEVQCKCSCCVCCRAIWLVLARGIRWFAGCRVVRWRGWVAPNA